jgi:hypothetical protein
MRKHAALLAADHAVLDNLQRQRQPWRERPLRTGAGSRRARAAGSLTPWSLATTATPTPATGGKERRPYWRPSARSTAKSLRTNEMLGSLNAFAVMHAGE